MQNPLYTWDNFVTSPDPSTSSVTSVQFQHRAIANFIYAELFAIGALAEDESTEANDNRQFTIDTIAASLASLPAYMKHDLLHTGAV